MSAASRAVFSSTRPDLSSQCNIAPPLEGSLDIKKLSDREASRLTSFAEEIAPQKGLDPRWRLSLAQPRRRALPLRRSPWRRSSPERRSPPGAPSPPLRRSSPERRSSLLRRSRPERRSSGIAGRPFAAAELEATARALPGLVPPLHLGAAPETALALGGRRLAFHRSHGWELTSGVGRTRRRGRDSNRRPRSRAARGSVATCGRPG